MMELFSRPWLLAAAAAAVACAAVLAWIEAARRGRLMARWSAEPPPGLAWRRRLKGLLGLSGLACLGLALAGPQWGVEMVEQRSQARQIAIALDLSKSMLAQDVKPSRIERAKAELSYLIDNLAGDRVGVVAFAGKAHVHCPLTTDAAAARMFLRSLEVGSVPQPGTAIAEALDVARDMLGRFAGDRALVLLTDGEDTAGSDELAAAKACAKEGIRVFTVGIGSPEGAPIPIVGPGGERQGYKTDRQGHTVMTRLDEEGLKRLAQAGGGEYLRLTESGVEMAGLLRKLKGLAAASEKQRAGRRYKDRFQWPLLLAWLLLLAELLLPERALAVRRPRAREAAPAALLLVLLTGTAARAARDDFAEGSRALQEGRWPQAVESLTAAEKAAPGDPRVEYQLGAALYRVGKFKEAAAAFEKAAAATPDEKRRRSVFNAGNAHFQAGEGAEAVKSFREAVVRDVSDKDAGHNLALALQQQDKKNKNKPRDKDKKKQDQDKKGGSPKDDNPRTRGPMSPEDAQRVLEAVQEREKASLKPDILNKRLQKKAKEPDVEKDW